jgi:thioredoxin-like negative regulator of GroEL
MADASSNSDWSPSTDPVAPADFEACPVLVLHYWAIWDLHDREMDKRLASLRKEYANRICFRSCDTDRAENKPFIQGIASIPALGCFIRGKWFRSLIGLRSVEELRSVLDGWLAAADMPANHPLLQTGAAGILSRVRKWLGRGSGY